MHAPIDGSLKKYTLVSRRARPVWTSVDKINHILKNDYLKHLSQCDVEMQEIGADSYSHLDFKRKYQGQSRTFIFYDLQLMTRNFFEGIAPLLDNPNSRFIFHVFGHFAFRAQDWSYLIRKSQGKAVHFVFSSSRHKEQFDSIFSQALDPLSSVWRPPFEVKTCRSYRRPGLLRLLYTGRISRIKNLDILLRAVDLLPQEVELSLVGEFDLFETENEFYPSALTRTYLEMKNPKRVKFYPFCGGEQLSAFYSEADAFVALSTGMGEDLGMSIKEALEYGLQVIVTDWGGHTDFPSRFIQTIDTACNKSFTPELQTLTRTLNSLSKLEATQRKLNVMNLQKFQDSRRPQFFDFIKNTRFSFQAQVNWTQLGMLNKFPGQLNSLGHSLAKKNRQAP